MVSRSCRGDVAAVGRSCTHVLRAARAARRQDTVHLAARTHAVQCCFGTWMKAAWLAAVRSPCDAPSVWCGVEPRARVCLVHSCNRDTHISPSSPLHPLQAIPHVSTHLFTTAPLCLACRHHRSRSSSRVSDPLAQATPVVMSLTAEPPTARHRRACATVPTHTSSIFTALTAPPHLPLPAFPLRRLDRLRRDGLL